ncbi:hypothetical protein N0V93_007718 [Gnomoniopsis smithogilvyi]|uniref:FAD-binding domain-containing protein n=1 Tax=Gnomoniopsis smithogilvyi TaxID=1191159 RepID=A0A9W8YKD5_9PEZI|nr:hypothetical protein N0V93_007718 [Gnomoniopsis smithogilvyi]
MSESKSLHVLIVGGGIGGLSAAIALRLQGHQVEVFEKSSLHTELGNAVYCAPNCTAALSHLGVYPGDIGGVLNNGFKFLDADCNLTRTMMLTEEDRARWVAEWYLIARVDLHNALKRQATTADRPGLPVKIHTGRTVTKLDCESATITLVDGSTVGGDLVVGADGVHSQTRPSILGHETLLVNHGICCYRLLISVADLLADPETSIFADNPGVFVQVTGDDGRICLYPCSSGRVMNLAAFVPKDEVGEIEKGLTGYDQTANKKQLMGHFRNFSPAVLRMLDKAPENSVKVWDLLDMDLQPSLIKDRALLIGDAAHPFLPHMGQGAAQAIEDGCALGVVLPLGTTADDVPKRLELWQQLRKERAHQVVEFTRHRAREANGVQGPPQTEEQFAAAMAYCINHDAWENAEKRLADSRR